TAVFLMSFSPKDLGVKNERTEFQKPTEITWQLLGQIDFVKQKNPYYGEVMYPMINSTLKALQGKKIKASGFIVPIDSKSYALSKNVFAQCLDRKSTRLNSSHVKISYAVFCLKK